MAEKAQEEKTEEKIEEKVDLGVKIKKDEVKGGTQIKSTPGELPPPLEAKEGEKPPEEEEEIAAKRIEGKIPISPALIKPPLRFEGLALSELTGYPGWIYSEEDLENITQLVIECGWELNPKTQVLFALAGLHGAKLAGYASWRKQGMPGDLRKKAGAGEIRPEKEVLP